MAEPLRILIVDDEPLAREALRNVLAAQPGISEIVEAFDQASCLDELRASRPTVVFLDIQMPETNLVELVREISAFDAGIPVIFVTAHSEYAVMAFEQHAADYILKPFSEARIAQALEKARERIRTRTVSDLLKVLPDLLRGSKEAANRLAVKTQGRILFLDPDEVHWIQANGNYVMLHCEGGSHLMRGTLADVEALLGDGKFLRIHRSVIVNSKYVREVQPWPTGEYILRLRSGKELTVTRKYKQNLSRIASLGLGVESFNGE